VGKNNGTAAAIDMIPKDIIICPLALRASRELSVDSDVYRERISRVARLSADDRGIEAVTVVL
jgi:hypothetical protein